MYESLFFDTIKIIYKWLTNDNEIKKRVIKKR